MKAQPYDGARHRRMPLRWQKCRNRYVLPTVWRTVKDDFGNDIKERVSVPCGTCETCVDRRCHETIGRMNAERHGVDNAYFITLTIGGDKRYGSGRNNPLAQEFRPELVRAYIKRLRKYAIEDSRRAWLQNHSDLSLHVEPRLRFLWVGENGARKGRVHYHLMCYWRGGDAPEVPRRFYDNVFHGKMDEACQPADYPTIPHEPGERNRTYWPWGFCYWKRMDDTDAAYVAKYMVKDRSNVDPGYVVTPASRSTRPLLGAAWFDYLAAQHVEQRLSPTAPNYMLDTDWKKRRTLFFLSRAGFMYFWRSFERQWIAVRKPGHGDSRDWWPHNEEAERFHKLEQKRLDAIPAAVIAAQELKADRAKYQKAMRERLAASGALPATRRGDQRTVEEVHAEYAGSWARIKAHRKAGGGAGSVDPALRAVLKRYAEELLAAKPVDNVAVLRKKLGKGADAVIAARERVRALDWSPTMRVIRRPTMRTATYAAIDREPQG